MNTWMNKKPNVHTVHKTITMNYQYPYEGYRLQHFNLCNSELTVTKINNHLNTWINRKLYVYQKILINNIVMEGYNISTLEAAIHS